MITDFISQLFTFQFFVESKLIKDVVVFVRGHQCLSLDLYLLEDSLPVLGLLHPQPVSPGVFLNSAPAETS